MSTKTLINRADVAIEDTWCLEDFYPSADNALASIKQCYVLTKDFERYASHLITSSKTLLEGLSAYFTLQKEVGRLYVYTHLKCDEDSTNSASQDLASQTEKLMIYVESSAAFVSPELSNLTQEVFDTFVTEAPELAIYTRMISEILRKKEHILDPTTESLLSQFEEIGSAPRKVFGMFNNADIKFPTITTPEGETVQLSHGNFIDFLQSPDRTLREDVFNKIYTTYEAFRNTTAALYSANVQQAALFASIRKFDSVRAQSLYRNNIPESVYDNLIQTVSDHLPLLHEYFDVRQQVLGVDALHMYDLYVPLVHDLNKKMTYDEGVALVLQAMEPLGTDYIALLKKAFKDRWVDKYENKGKRSGAYSWGCNGAPHPYVLMNFTENLNNVFTLAHEMGHAVHSYLSHRTQPQPHASYCIFVAEVASTVNESLLMQHLLKTTQDPMYRKYLINYFMEQFRSTVYRQTMFAEFEKLIFDAQKAGTSLTPDFLCTTYYALAKKYHGDKMVVDQCVEIEWSRIPHFFNSPFYVYQYATGFSAAITLSKRILEEGESAVVAYKNFLRSGGSKDPIDLLKDAGVDMSTSAPITQALALFKDLIAEFKTLL